MAKMTEGREAQILDESVLLFVFEKICHFLSRSNVRCLAERSFSRCTDPGSHQFATAVTRVMTHEPVPQKMSSTFFMNFAVIEPNKDKRLSSDFLKITKIKIKSAKVTLIDAPKSADLGLAKIET